MRGWLRVDIAGGLGSEYWDVEFVIFGGIVSISRLIQIRRLPPRQTYTLLFTINLKLALHTRLLSSPDLLFHFFGCFRFRGHKIPMVQSLSNQSTFRFMFVQNG